MDLIKLILDCTACAQEPVVSVSQSNAGTAVVVAFMAVIVVAGLIMIEYYQTRYLHAIRALNLICEERKISPDDAIEYVRRTKHSKTRWWKAVFDEKRPVK